MLLARVCFTKRIFWEMREHVVISSWFGIVGSLFPCEAFLLRFGMRVSLRIGFNRGRFRFCKDGFLSHRFRPRENCEPVLHLLFSFPLGKVQALFNGVLSSSFSGTRFLLAEECSHGIVSEDGVVDCLLTAHKRYDGFCAAFNGLLSFR